MEIHVSNSRSPETLTGLMRELGPLARAATGADTAAGDIVVVAIPVKGYHSVPAGPLTEGWRQQRGMPAYGAPTDRSTTKEARPPTPTRCPPHWPALEGNLIECSGSPPPRRARVGLPALCIGRTRTAV
jgi:hypothetical protein